MHDDEEADDQGFQLDNDTGEFRLSVLLSGSAYNGLRGAADKLGLPASEYAAILLEKKSIEYWDEVFKGRRSSSHEEMGAKHRIKLAAASISRDLERTENVQPD